MLFSIENKQYTLDTINDEAKYKNILTYVKDNNFNYYDTFMLIADDKEDFLKPFQLDIKHLILQKEFTMANKYEKEDFTRFGFKYKDLFLKSENEKEAIDKGTKVYNLKDGRKLYYSFHKAAEYSSGEWIMLDNVSFNDPKLELKNDREYKTQIVEANKNIRLKTEEGISAFQNLDIANIKLEVLSFDEELKGLFKDALLSANKLASYIKDNIELETKVFVFYNHVALIKNWIEKIIELKKLSLSDEEYMKVKEEAIRALPSLKSKIDDEYDRYTMPIVEDLKAEMEAVSKY